MDTSERCKKAIEVLQATDDGNDLSEFELWIVQGMVNGHLTQKGYDYFNKIYRERVRR